MRSRFNGHWLLTLFLFSPRWVIVLPMAMLLPLTIWVRPRSAWLYAVHLVVIVFAILGFELRGFGVLSDTSIGKKEQASLHVLSCNIGSGTLDEESLATLIREQKIDVVLLQECRKPAATSFFGLLGWSFQHEHSIAIGSSLELSAHVTVNRDFRRRPRPPVALACKVRLANGEKARVVSVHLPTFRPALSKMQDFHFVDGAKAMQSQGESYRSLVERLLEHLEKSDVPTILAGDFNVPIESIYYQDYWRSLTNAYSLKGFGFGYTKFTRWHGVRIDHILVDNHWQVLSTHVGPYLGGDHRPVITKIVKISSP